MQVRAERRLDEVELAAARFGGRWGLVAGVVFVIALIYLPPIQLLLVELGAVLGRKSGYPRAVEPRLFMFGVVCTFLAQDIFRFILAAAWKWSKR
jgi:formate hydrogenlyase subunit 3/multisubunit Na+/H+ antiporter MnhD subunit